MTRSILCTLLIIIISCGNALARQTAATGNPKETAAPAARNRTRRSRNDLHRRRNPGNREMRAGLGSGNPGLGSGSPGRRTEVIAHPPIRGKKAIPTRRRIDPQNQQLKFAYKGEVIMGLTASYGRRATTRTSWACVSTSADGRPPSNPSSHDNNCLGVRFGYRHMDLQPRRLGQHSEGQFQQRQLLVRHFPPLLRGTRPEGPFRTVRRVRALAVDRNVEALLPARHRQRQHENHVQRQYAAQIGV